MSELLLIIHVIAAICLIVLVLVQQGKGATMGAAYGSGASQTVFGSRGSGSFLLKITVGFVIVFFATSIALNYIVSKDYKAKQQVIQLPKPMFPAPTSSLPLGVASPNSIPALPENVSTQKTK